MPMTQPNMKSLSELTERQATGEFILVSGELEVHFFFQRGRVAWGTNSKYRHAFSRHLSHNCDLDQETFTEVLEICQQEKTPLGETLIKSGLATLQDVREALASQLMETLRCVAEIREAQTVFLPRKSFSDYDSTLTFSLESLVERVSTTADSDRQTSCAQDGLGCDVHAMFDELQAAVPEALWMELVSAEGTTSVPSSHANEVGRTLSPVLLDGGADFVAIHSPHGIVLGGVTAHNDETLWVGLGETATIGNSLSALSPMLSATLSTDLLASTSEYSQSSWKTCGEDSATLRGVCAAVEDTEEVLAAFTLDSSGRLLWACSRESLALDEFTERARPRFKAFEHPVLDEPARTGGQPLNASSSALRRSMVISDPQTWTYGCTNGYGARSCLWLLIDRSTSQGLGWAILTSLSRIAFSPEVSS